MTHPDLSAVLGDAVAPAVVAHLAECPRCRQDRAAIFGAEPDLLVLATAAQPPDRYQLRCLLGEGGLGTVYRAWDRTLDRGVALKVPRDGALRAVVLQREARLLAQLDHPGIPAIHEIGALADGRPYYTMEEVRGTTLRHLLFERLPTRRAVDLLRRVCDIVAYAHAQGVVHRDLKPENVRVGDYDELAVIDWGLGSANDEAPLRGGTDGYVSSEQRRGDAAHPSTDVFALGVMLREVLEGGAGHLPAALADACASATATDPTDRPTAAALSDALRGWLDGEARTDAALTAVAAADRRIEEREELLADADRLRAAARAHAQSLRPHEAIHRKREGWQASDRAAELEGLAQEAQLDALTLLGRALELDPAQGDARHRIVALHRAGLTEAERRNDQREVRRLTRRLQDAGDVDWLATPATVSLATEPSGVEVVAHRLAVVDRRLQPVERVRLGPTPVEGAPLAPGSWQLVLAGGPVVPVRLERGETWSPTGPDGTSAALGVPREISGASFVPAGWFHAGGDGNAIDALSRRRVWVPGFYIQTFPVTVAEYLTFLDDLEPDVALSRAPAEIGGHRDRPHPLLRREDGCWRAPPELAWAPDAPVVQLDSVAAEAYAAWWSTRTGLRWALPHELEWEKAARGTDERPFPWGDQLDPAFARVDGSEPGAPSRGSVHDFPTDVSPYGVRGLGGNVRDWCGNAYVRGGDTADGEVLRPLPADDRFRVVRGGSFTSVEPWCRAAARFGLRPGERSGSVGFRLVHRLG